MPAETEVAIDDEPGVKLSDLLRGVDGNDPHGAAAAAGSAGPAAAGEPSNARAFPEKKRLCAEACVFCGIAVYARRPISPGSDFGLPTAYGPGVAVAGEPIFSGC